jgi:pimeloyl-ACP methyl ester carboxylesterase
MVVSGMLHAEIQRAEGARYAASLVLLPGLWAGPDAWRACAGYLAHRGWESRLVDLRGIPGGAAARGEALAATLGGLGGPAVVLAHGGAAATALAAAARGAVQAVVLVAPLVPGSGGARALTLGAGTLLPLVLGRPVPPPVGRREALLLGALPEPVRGRVRAGFAPEAPAIVWETARGAPASAAPGVPALVVGGGRDPLLPAAEAAALAAALGGEHTVLPAAGAWPLAGPAWQPLVGAVHRWLVRRLGEPLLDLYPEAMAAREEDGEEP